jgi:hypothetical protein
MSIRELTWQIKQVVSNSQSLSIIGYFYSFSPLTNKPPDSPKIFSIKIPGFPEILGILHQRNQHLQLLRSG